VDGICLWWCERKIGFLISKSVDGLEAYEDAVGLGLRLITTAASAVICTVAHDIHFSPVNQTCINVELYTGTADR
jgi:hypothetical protein